ncbi:hypothetical protein ACVCAH_36525 [Micromonospora sp. LZ34]
MADPTAANGRGRPAVVNWDPILAFHQVWALGNPAETVATVVRRQEAHIR